MLKQCSFLYVYIIIIFGDFHVHFIYLVRLQKKKQHRLLDQPLVKIQECLLRLLLRAAQPTYIMIISFYCNHCEFISIFYKNMN